MAGSPRRVLVRLPNWLGDVLMARPLLFGLRAALPQAGLWCVGPAGPLALLGADPLGATLLEWSAGGAAGAALLGRLRAWRPDVALVLPPSFSSAWFAWRSGARARVGYRGEARSWLLTRALRRPARGDRHVAGEYLDLAADLGVSCDIEPPPPLRAPAGGAAGDGGSGLDVLLRGTPAADGAPFALIGPGAAYGPAKRWAAERFAGVARALGERGLAVLAVGSAAEARACAEVAERVGAGAASLAGRTRLEQLAALAARAAVTVCNDSGLAHLCAATGAPTVTVFGSTSSAWTAPLGPRVRVVQRPPVCSPCFRRTCRIGYACLEAVTVRDVLAACEGLLAGREAA
jgi:heptosyltransferase II